MSGRKEKEKRVREVGELLTSQMFYYRDLQTYIKKKQYEEPLQAYHSVSTTKSSLLFLYTPAHSFQSCCYFEANLRHQTFISQCMFCGLNICMPHPNSYTEAQTSNVVGHICRWHLLGDNQDWLGSQGRGPHGGVIGLLRRGGEAGRASQQGEPSLGSHEEAPWFQPPEQGGKQLYVLFKPLHLGCSVMQPELRQPISLKDKGFKKYNCKTFIMSKNTIPQYQILSVYISSVSEMSFLKKCFKLFSGSRFLD